MPKPPIPECPTCAGSGRATIQATAQEVACVCTTTMEDYTSASPERLAELRALSQQSRRHIREGRS